MAETQHITLRELQRRVKAALEGQFALPVWVSAEISAHLQSSVFKLSKDLIDSIHEEGIVAYTS